MNEDEDVSLACAVTFTTKITEDEFDAHTQTALFGTSEGIARAIDKLDDIILEEEPASIIAVRLTNGKISLDNALEMVMKARQSRRKKNEDKE